MKKLVQYVGGNIVKIIGVMFVIVSICWLVSAFLSFVEIKDPARFNDDSGFIKRQIEIKDKVVRDCLEDKTCRRPNSRMVNEIEEALMQFTRNTARALVDYNYLIEEIVYDEEWNWVPITPRGDENIEKCHISIDLKKEEIERVECVYNLTIGNFVFITPDLRIFENKVQMLENQVIIELKLVVRGRAILQIYKPDCYNITVPSDVTPLFVTLVGAGGSGIPLYGGGSGAAINNFPLYDMQSGEIIEVCVSKGAVYRDGNSAPSKGSDSIVSTKHKILIAQGGTSASRIPEGTFKLIPNCGMGGGVIIRHLPEELNETTHFNPNYDRCCENTSHVEDFIFVSGASGFAQDKGTCQTSQTSTSKGQEARGGSSMGRFLGGCGAASAYGNGGPNILDRTGNTTLLDPLPNTGAGGGCSYDWGGSGSDGIFILDWRINTHYPI